MCVYDIYGYIHMREDVYIYIYTERERERERGGRDGSKNDRDKQRVGDRQKVRERTEET